MVIFGGEGNSTNFLNDIAGYTPPQTMYLYLKP